MGERSQQLLLDMQGNPITDIRELQNRILGAGEVIQDFTKTKTQQQQEIARLSAAMQDLQRQNQNMLEHLERLQNENSKLKALADPLQSESEDESDASYRTVTGRKRKYKPKVTNEKSTVNTHNYFDVLASVTADMQQQVTPVDTPEIDVETHNEHGMVNIRNYLDAKQPPKGRQDFPALKTPKQTINSRTFNRTQTKQIAKKVDHFEEKDGMRLPVFVNEPEQPMPQQEDTNQTLNNTVRVPPITLIDTHMYKVVKETLKENNISPKYTISTKDGLKIFLSSIEEYRTTIRIIDQLKVRRFTYTLQQEKPLRVVLRGVPLCISEEDVQESLAEQGIQATTVKRMQKNAETLYQ